MYADENSGFLPAPVAVGYRPGTAWVHGQLDFSSANPDNTNTANLVDPRRATLAPYVRDPAVFRCPADMSSVRGPSGTLLPRVRSYSMSEAMGTASAGWLPTPQYLSFLKREDIITPKPADAWVVAEEHPDSINDTVLAVQIAEESTATWARIVDYPSALHDGAANLAFADGHVELRHWVDQRTRPPVWYQNSLPLNVSSPSNRDVLWLSERTSSRAR
jgi:prepilin-type processing-associated H-X9-DG protein